MQASLLATVNLLLGQYQYNVPNIIFLALMVGSLVLNRLGFMAVATTITVALLVAGSLLVFSEKALAQTFIIACVPVFIASFLIVPWSGIVVAAVIIFGTLLLGYDSINYLSLFVLTAVTAVVYLSPGT